MLILVNHLHLGTFVFRMYDQENKIVIFKTVQRYLYKLRIEINVKNCFLREIVIIMRQNIQTRTPWTGSKTSPTIATKTAWKFKWWWIQNKNVGPKTSTHPFFHRRNKNTTMWAIETGLQKKEGQQVFSF